MPTSTSADQARLPAPSPSGSSSSSSSSSSSTPRHALSQQSNRHSANTKGAVGGGSSRGSGQLHPPSASGGSHGTAVRSSTSDGYGSGSGSSGDRSTQPQCSITSSSCGSSGGTQLQSSSGGERTQPQCSSSSTAGGGNSCSTGVSSGSSSSAQPQNSGTCSSGSMQPSASSGHSYQPCISAGDAGAGSNQAPMSTSDSSASKHNSMPCAYGSGLASVQGRACSRGRDHAAGGIACSPYYGQTASRDPAPSSTAAPYGAAPASAGSCDPTSGSPAPASAAPCQQPVGSAVRGSARGGGEGERRHCGGGLQDGLAVTGVHRAATGTKSWAGAAEGQGYSTTTLSASAPPWLAAAGEGAAAAAGWGACASPQHVAAGLWPALGAAVGSRDVSPEQGLRSRSDDAAVLRSAQLQTCHITLEARCKVSACACAYVWRDVGEVGAVECDKTRLPRACVCVCVCARVRVCAFVHVCVRHQVVQCRQLLSCRAIPPGVQPWGAQLDFKFVGWHISVRVTRTHVRSQTLMHMLMQATQPGCVQAQAREICGLRRVCLDSALVIEELSLEVEGGQAADAVHGSEAAAGGSVGAVGGHKRGCF